MEELSPPGADAVGTVDSDGVAISWRQYGRGDRTILFVPTWNLVDSRTLRHQVGALRDSFRVITYDARGSGASDRPETGYGYDEHAADAAAVLAATGTASCAVVTASRGASTAVLLAARHPDMVERMVLIAPALNLTPDEDTGESFFVERSHYEGWERYSAPSWRTDFEGFVRWFMAKVFSEPDSQATIDEMVSIALDADPEMLIRQEAEQDWDQAAPHLPELRCPVLVLQGTDDQTIDLQLAPDLVAALPSADLVWLEGLGHRPDVRRPDLVNPLLRAFVT